MNYYSLTFAFVTLSSVFIIVWSLILFARARNYIEPKMFRRLLIIFLGIATWVTISAGAAFNGAIYDVTAQTPFSLFFRVTLLLALPLLISIKSLLTWRDITHDFEARFKQ